MGRSKNRNNKSSMSYSDRKKNEYINVTYQELKDNSRTVVKGLKLMKGREPKYIETNDNYGGIPRWLDLVSNAKGWEFSEYMPSKRNCGYNQDAYKLEK